MPSEYSFAGIVFDEAVDGYTKEQSTLLGLLISELADSSVRTGVIYNIAIACHAQEVCDYVIEKLT